MSQVRRNYKMVVVQNIFLLAITLFLVSCKGKETPSNQPSAAVWPTQDWQTATPKSQAMDSKKLTQMLAAIKRQKLGLHSLLVIRNGFLVSENYFDGYRLDRQHELYSCTKSFLATLIGIAIQQGKITSINQKALTFFPEIEFENVDERKQALALEHLLTMTAGLEWEENGAAHRALLQSNDWLQYMLDLPMRETPGSHFNYCSGCSHILSAILQAQTGMPTQEFAEENLFAALGIEDYTWATDASGNAIGGWGLQLTPRQMAKLGYLYLHNGNWNGKQIVPKEWVQQSTQVQVTTGDRNGDFGYHWRVFPELGGYAALGMGGQMIFIAPHLNLIVVTTAEINSFEVIFRLLESYILPAAG